jgi:hypothetical protein
MESSSLGKPFLIFLSGLLIAYLIFSGSENYIMESGKNLIEKMADAIQRFEGWAPGSVSYKNNNPGNIKASNEPWIGQRAIDSRGFVVFDTYEHGRRALLISLTNAATGKSSVYSPTDSIYEFFGKYAPASDSNQPRVYAQYVAKEIGINPDASISQLV